MVARPAPFFFRSGNRLGPRVFRIGAPFRWGKRPPGVATLQWGIPLRIACARLPRAFGRGALNVSRALYGRRPLPRGASFLSNEYRFSDPHIRSAAIMRRRCNCCC